MRGWRKCLAIGLFACVPAAQACINAVGTDRNGKSFEAHNLIGAERLRSMSMPVQERYAWLYGENTIRRARKDPSWRNGNDLAVLLILQGQHVDAIRYLVALEKAYPGHPEIAANLGTALELAGHDAVALKWIRLGMQRNPDEHAGTEWLHARILAAKIAAKQDPAWYRTHSIVGLEFDDALVPAVPKTMPTGNTRAPLKPSDVERALDYQLYERMGFVRKRDPVVANLLHDWALLHLAGGSLETATAAFDAAVRYGWPEDARLRERKAFIAGMLQKPKDANFRGTCAVCL